ncbi:RES family NAD+ phosphorylase [Stutzerimonas kirkiae]|uniref:RES domain-containing protein n=1 Tax=Stutzerimonas kirkiae TaxID=2211392 RepID=A0A4Q9QY98_9GAMM|nr:RES family NAD+ phosphorylase [Stutzerimonas kirkiae]TBU88853.1 RES domain-containing protein [Stutzerimonas kirkiae]TBU99023.1 RES domain-containing protein [Stutzerimonas kirkiae]TBV04180.1 RES domain-containing protein [Stutzerimonas kirkiae]TBV15406.1 RES domain-containing protein [Stutzerimonas kirkiae]
MRAWRIAKAARAADLSGKGAAIEGGRWNDAEVPAVYLGLSPAICCLETFVHQTRRPLIPMKISLFELPDAPSLYLEPEPGSLPDGWASLPADRPSMAFGTHWLEQCGQLGLILPSAVLRLERNIMLNPRHPAMADVRLVEILDFAYDERLFIARA